jgi:hypothetical protein
MSVCVYYVFMLSFVQVATLRQADPPSKECYRLFKRSRYLKCDQGPTKDCRDIERQAGIYMIASAPISTTYLLNSSYQPVSVRVYVFPLSLLGNGSLNTFPLQRIHTTVEEFLDASFCMRSVSFRRVSVGMYVYPLIVARQRLSKHVPTTMKNCCRRCFLCSACRIKGK